MFAKKKMLALVVLLNACSLTPRPQQSTLLGDCLRMIDDQYLWQKSPGISSSHSVDFLIRIGVPNWRNAKRIGVLNKGTRVHIHQILKDSNGSWGQYLLVQVKILDGKFAGTIADIPIHAPYHPRQKWTKNFTLDPNALDFDESVVESCN